MNKNKFFTLVWLIFAIWGKLENNDTGMWSCLVISFMHLLTDEIIEKINSIERRKNDPR